TAAGHVLRTRSDTEPIVHAWEARGPDALDDLEGMFGLAVWNDATRTLVLARDRLGIKPVYYAVLPEGLVFASELKAMFEHPGVSRELDMQALSAYLAHDWVPAPRSMLKSVRKLPPGHRLIYAGGEPRGDASILPTYLLSRFARKSVTVALSGDGGDELFAGYPTYQAHRVAHTWARAPRAARAVARAAVNRMPVSHDNLSLDFRLKRFVAGADLDLVTRHAVWMGSYTPAEQRGLLTPGALARLPDGPSYAEWERMAAAAPAEPWLHRVLYLDLKGYLGEG